MSKKTILAILGGDGRHTEAVRYFCENGLLVHCYGIEKPGGSPCDAVFFKDWRAALGGARILLLPIPISRDGVFLNLAADRGEAPRISDVLATIEAGTVVFGGGVLPERGDIVSFDLLKDRDFLLENARISAEGALMLAMQQTRSTITGARVAVIGYGRIGRALAGMLRSLGAEVLVAARKDADLSHAGSIGCEVLDVKDATALIKLGVDRTLIFNTVPQILLDARVLGVLQKDCLIIDLASAPGGVDALAAGEIGLRVLWARGIPGKYAPQSAGQVLASTVLREIGEGLR